MCSPLDRSRMLIHVRYKQSYQDRLERLLFQSSDQGVIVHQHAESESQSRCRPDYAARHDSSRPNGATSWFLDEQLPRRRILLDATNQPMGRKTIPKYLTGLLSPCCIGDGCLLVPYSWKVCMVGTLIGLKMTADCTRLQSVR
jgi:hypothetical protein